MENRVEILRSYIDKLVETAERGEFYFVDGHMKAVSAFGAMLAFKRNLDPEIATIMGLLHDIHTILTNDPTNHAELGAVKTGEILNELNILDREELEIVCTAIHNHSSKAIVQDGYSELLKDADVMAHYLFNVNLPVMQNEVQRLGKLREELGF